MTKEELEKYAEQYCMDKFGAKTGNKPVKDALIYGYNLAIQIHFVAGQKERSFCKCGSVKNGGYGCSRTDCGNTLTALMEKELNLQQKQ